MKNMKYMVVALVAAIALLGVGYAQWSDSVTMTDTVITGKMDVQVVDAVVYSTLQPSEQWQTTTVDWKDANQAIVTMRNVYPGGNGRVDVKFENKGTVPVVLSSVSVQRLEGSEALFNKLVAAVDGKYNTDGKIGEAGTDTFYVGKKPLASYEFTQLFNFLKTDPTHKYVIKPGGQIGFCDEPEEEGCIRIGLPTDADNTFQELSCKFLMTFNFEQQLPPSDNVSPTWYGRTNAPAGSWPAPVVVTP